MSKAASNKSVHILLVIKDQDFYQELLQDQQSKNFIIHYAQDTKTAMEYLKLGEKYFHCIFVNPKLNGQEDIKILEQCHTGRTGVPVYLILNDMRELGDELNVAEHGIHGTITNKNELIAISRVIEQGLGQFDAEAAMKLAAQTPDPEEGEEGDKLVAINAANFLSGTTSFFDLFVKIRQGKFVKILNARDSFDTERLEYYRAKGLTHFWIKKETQKLYIDFCDKLASKIIQSKSIKDSVKVTMTLNQGQEVMGFLARNGLDQDSLAFAASYSDNVSLLTKQLAQKNAPIQSLLKNIAAFEHAAGTAMICGLMARHTQIESTQAMNVLGLAATLHDIGLYKDKGVHQDTANTVDEINVLDEIDIELELKKENLPQSRRKELQLLYELHPEKSAELCRAVDDVHEDVIQIILHHHEKVDGTGFPNKLSGPAINPLAQILGVADEFSKLIRKIYLGKAPREDLHLFSSRLRGYSLKTVKVWEALFLKAR